MSTGLADQNPAIAAYLEEAWEGIALTITRLGCERSIWLVILLITWLGTGKAYQWIALWTEERGGNLWQIECRLLLINNNMLCLQAIKGIAESHVIVADAESYLHILPLTVDE